MFVCLFLEPGVYSTDHTSRLADRLGERRKARKTLLCLFMCEQVLFVRFYNNPAPVIRSMQFHYCTVSNPGTGADDAFVLKRGV